MQALALVPVHAQPHAMLYPQKAKAYFHSLRLNTVTCNRHAQARSLAAAVHGVTASQIRRADVEALLVRHGASILAAVVALAVSLLLVGRAQQQPGGLPLHSHATPMVRGRAAHLRRCAGCQ